MEVCLGHVISRKCITRPKMAPESDYVQSRKVDQLFSERSVMRKSCVSLRLIGRWKMMGERYRIIVDLIFNVGKDMVTIRSE